MCVHALGRVHMCVCVCVCVYVYTHHSSFFFFLFCCCCLKEQCDVLIYLTVITGCVCCGASRRLDRILEVTNLCFLGHWRISGCLEVSCWKVFSLSLCRTLTDPEDSFEAKGWGNGRYRTQLLFSHSWNVWLVVHGDTLLGENWFQAGFGTQGWWAQWWLSTFISATISVLCEMYPYSSVTPLVACSHS